MYTEKKLMYDIIGLMMYYYEIFSYINELI